MVDDKRHPPYEASEVLSMTQLRDAHNRQIEYPTMSVTDRCDFRCVYCMAEDMTFLPRQQVLGWEELERIARIFVGLGVKKIRLTGGEPLVRQGSVGRGERIAALPGLRELVMTTNGSQLVKLAAPRARAGGKRLNSSLNSPQAAKVHAITRTGQLQQVLDGSDAARDAGFERIKLNAVVMKGRNAEEVADLVDFAIAGGLDLSFIEEMPLGDVGRSRGESFCSSDEVKALIAERHALIDSAEQTAIAVKDKLTELNLNNSKKTIGKKSFFVSDSPEKFKKLGERFLGKRIGTVRLVDINSY